MNKTLIFFDLGYTDTSLELLAAVEKIGTSGEKREISAKQISIQTDLRHGQSPHGLAYALCINHSEEDLANISAEFDCIIKINDEQLQSFDAANIASAIVEVQQIHNFDTILLPATANGMAIAPRVAMRLGTGLTADVTDAADGQLIRPAFDGKILAGIVNKDGVRPLMATIRPGAFKYNLRQAKTARVVAHIFSSYAQSGLQLLETRAKPPSKDIRDSRVLISGGGGIAKDFHKLEILAKALNGQVAASRKIVDAGIARRNIQVGQSGKTVTPALYMAFGIYGALQHVEGLKNVKHLIVVNTDRFAPLCYMANIVVEGDAAEFLELLCTRISTLGRIRP